MTLVLTLTLETLQVEVALGEALQAQTLLGRAEALQVEAALGKALNRFRRDLCWDVERAQDLMRRGAPSFERAA